MTLAAIYLNNIWPFLALLAILILCAAIPAATWYRWRAWFDQQRDTISERQVQKNARDHDR